MVTDFKNKEREKLIADTVRGLSDLRKNLESSVPEQFDKFCDLILKEQGQESSQEFLSGSRSHGAEQFSVDKEHVIEMIMKYAEISGADPAVRQNLRDLLVRYRH